MNDGHDVITNQDGSKFFRRNKPVYRLVMSAVFAAFIYVFTLINIPIPIGPGYVNLGDVFIFLACTALGWWAVVPAVIGSALADLTLGWVWYIPGTIVIKGAMAAIAVLIGGKFHTGWRTVIAFLVSSLFMQAGYMAYQLLAILTFNPAGDTIKNIFVPLAILFNLIQTIVCVPVACVAVTALKHLNVLERIRGD